jgi:hypothetical protein
VVKDYLAEGPFGSSVEKRKSHYAKA